MSRSTSLAIAAAAAVLLAPWPARGQAQPDAIPRDVVMMILRHHEGYGQPDVRVGSTLPAELAAIVPLPPGSRLVAVLRDRTTSIIGTAAMAPDSIRAWFNAEFERRGYLPPEPSMGRRAFRPAERSVAANGYCSGTDHLTVAARPARGGPTEFVVRVGRAGNCERPSQPIETMTGWTSSGSNPPSLPLLYHPPTAELDPVCARAVSNGSSVATEDAIATNSSAQQLFTHYAGQLEASGWVRDPFAAAVGSWTRRDSTGRNVRVHLSVEAAAGGPDCRRLRLNAAEVER